MRGLDPGRRACTRFTQFRVPVDCRNFYDIRVLFGGPGDLVSRLEIGLITYLLSPLPLQVVFSIAFQIP